MPPTTRSQADTAAAVFATGRADVTAANNTDGAQLRQRPREGSRSRTIEDVYDPKYVLDRATNTKENVYLFAPNLIGYARVILAAASLYYMPIHPKVCTVLYGVSCLLDAVDGLAARLLKQESKFGAVLDMVTDRCTTACLLCFLASTEYYKSYALVFQFLIALDFASHYIHMYSSLLTGASSHKNITSDVSRILYYYYNDKLTLFTFCFCNELFFVTLYLNASLVGALCFPICALKQIINVVQFWKASKILVGIDLEEREKALKREQEKKALNDNAVVQ